MEIISSLKNNNVNSNILHKSFEIGILLKAIDGVLEIIGGILLIFLNPSRLSKLVIWLTQRELSEDPRDVVANFLLRLSSKFTVSVEYFGVFYLVSHGIVKLVLIIFLWKRKPWAYPLTIVSLILFIIYQIYRYTLQPSIGLIILTIFDIVMIILTFIEYKRVKNAMV